MKVFGPLVKFLMLAPLIAACTSAPPFDARAVVKEWSAYIQQDYALNPGDTLIVTVHPVELTQLQPQEILIPPTGQVNLARIPKELRAIGKTVRAFREEIKNAYAEVFVGNIQIQVSLLSTAVSSVYVAGEVRAPGPKAYVNGMTLSQAVAAAGGTKITAKISDVRLLRNKPGEKPRTFRINLDEILYDSQPDFMVLPGDVVFCQTSGIADAGNWVELYIRRLLPINLNSAAAGGL